MPHECDALPGLNVTFRDPVPLHDVIVDGWSVPLLKANLQNDAEDHVQLVLDDRISVDLTAAEAEKLTPFLADAIAVALGYGAHPGEDMEFLPERAPHASPRRCVDVMPEDAA
jgi:hypothetical protein